MAQFCLLDLAAAGLAATAINREVGRQTTAGPAQVSIEFQAGARLLLSIFGIVVGVLTFYEFCREMIFVVLR